MKSGRWMGVAVALAGGCSDQVQQHPSTDASVARADAADVAEARDAGDATSAADAVTRDVVDAGVERLVGIDPMIRDAFDGRSAEVGPEVEVGAVRWPRGVQPLLRVRGRYVWVGSGVDSNGRWAYPIFTFTPTADGRGTSRELQWLSDAPPYEPTQVHPLSNDTTLAVCSRDHWTGTPGTFQEQGYCRLLEGAPPAALALGARRAPLGLTTGLAITGDSVHTNRWWVLGWGLRSQPTWHLHHLEYDLSAEADPEIRRSQSCPVWSAGLATPNAEAWVVSSFMRDDCTDPHRFRIERVGLPGGRTIQEPIDVHLDEGAWALPNATVDTVRVASDPEDGVAAVLQRQVPGDASDVDTYFLRAYLDGAWGLRRLTDAATSSWIVGAARGEWVYGYVLPAQGPSPRRLMLVRLDGNGRRLTPPLEYARGLDLDAMAYGYDPEARALWLLYVVKTNASLDDHLYTLYLRRVVLNPPPT